MPFKKLSILIVNRRSIAGNNRQSMSVRVRLLEPFLYLEAEGKIAITELDESIICEDDIAKVDVVAMSRSYSPDAVKTMEIARFLSKPILYDVDDDMFVLPKWTMLGTGEFEKHKRQLVLANHVVVPHALLAERLEGIRAPITIIPTGTVINDANIKNHKPKNKIIYTNLMDIKLESGRTDFLKAISDFMFQHPDLVMDVFSDTPLEICSIPNVKYCGFLEYAEYKKKIAKEGYLFAVCPLSGNEDISSLLHNECKSPIKYIDYSASKIPGIYSNSPAYQRSIKQGENGLLTENTYSGWLEGLKLIYENTKLREHITKEAFSDVSKKYDMKIVAKQWLDVIQQLANLRP